MQGRALVRAVLAKSAGDVTNGTQAATSMISNALTNAVTGSPSAAVAGIAVAAAIEAAQLGYASITAYTESSHNAYELFLQDHATGTATFFLPENESDRSGSQRFFYNFIQLIQGSENASDSLLYRYAGISVIKNVDVTRSSGIFGTKKIKGTRYAIISMAKSAFAGPYEDADTGDELLDIALHGSDIFLQDRVPTSLDEVFNYTPTGTGFITQHAWTTGHLTPEVLSRLNLVRFMIIVFANLLVQAQHPADLNAATDIPLNGLDTIAFCKDINSRINTLLLQSRDKKYEYLGKMICKDSFEAFIRLVKREVEELQEGHESKILNQLNLKELIAQSRGVLQVLNGLWHTILYLNRPSSSSVKLRYLVRSLSNYLDDALSADPKFWTKISQIEQRKKKKVTHTIPGLNTPLNTVIDLIGLVASLPLDQQNPFLSTMEEQGIPGKICQILKQLIENFIQPLSSELTKSKSNAAQAFLMNLISLSIESHPAFLQEAVIKIPGKLQIQQQISVINSAYANAQPPVFSWHILHCFGEDSKPKNSTPSKSQAKRQLTTETIQHFLALLRAQYQFLLALRGVKELQDVLDANKNMLLNPNVRIMLKKSLSILQTQANTLDHTLRKLMTHVSTTDKIDDQEKDEHANWRISYIQAIDSGKQGLSQRMDVVRDEFIRTTGIVDSPDFLKRLEQHLLDDIDEAVLTSQGNIEARALLHAALPSHLGPTIESGSSVSKERQSAEAQPFLSEPSQSNISVASTEDTSEPLQTSNSSLRLQLVLQILRWTSAFLFITGLVMGLMLTLGAPYFLTVLGLTAEQLMVGTVVSTTSSVIGGIGLVAVSFFFKAPSDGTTASPAATHHSFI